MTHRDVDLLTHRIDSLTRAATRLRRHIADLHALAYEPAVHDNEPTRSPGFESRPPPGADNDWPELGRKPPKKISGRDRARHLWERIAVEVGRCEDLMVGLERDMTAHFFAYSQNPEPSRGSLISAAEHAQLLAKQRARADTPARLVDQPAHPGRQR